MRPDILPEAAVSLPRRLCHLNLGFLRDRHLQAMLKAAGFELHFGLPRPQDGVLVWGASPRAYRGEWLAKRYNVPLIRAEDGLLHGVKPGRMGGKALGLYLDLDAVHFDPATPSQLERLLKTHPLDDSHLLGRAKTGIARLRQMQLSKYNLHDPDLALPPPGYVLVIDQTRGDAALRASGADRSRFLDMLAGARAAHPAARILIKTHPETMAGLRPGHFEPQDLDAQMQLYTEAASPWALLEGAIAVYTVSSQLGFEAILAGHRPEVWGQPFYAGWGLSHDQMPLPKRQRNLTPAQLFAAAMLLSPLWYDPCRARLCSFEEVIDQLTAETRAWREDRHGYIAAGMRLWKRRRLQEFFGRETPLRFVDDPVAAAQQAAQQAAQSRAPQRRLILWANRARDDLGGPYGRVEDGFLRSRGLGAALVPPLSLIRDDLGIYYDPSQPSGLEQLLSEPLPPGGRLRAERLIAALRQHGLSKYNLGGTLPPLPAGYRILVPGQVEDDASILKGGGTVRSNLALLQACRAAHPQAVILYKPHPDVLAGLRPGAVAEAELAGLADLSLPGASITEAIEAVDAVWTMTSLTGFEALLRGKKVTTLGAPFYAGWGLTEDLGTIPERRLRRADGSRRLPLDLTHLAHAALIAYPRYWDPVSRRACPPEVIVTRLAEGQISRPGLALRLLSKLQGRFASHARFWR